MVYDLTFQPIVGALKSPFVKGDLGGFSGAYQIPPDPPLSKGGIGKEFRDESHTYPVNLPTENPEAP
jgi:hypothetical protein